MPSPKKIVIIAVEESGDMHGAQLVSKLLSWDASLQISGIGGRHMQAAGAHLVSDLARFGATGVTAVLRHIVVIKKAFTLIKQYLKTLKPDLLILIDSPGFNLPIAKFAKQKLGLPIVYYISPQIWAWKPNRIQTIRQNVDHMAVILPFEKPIYEQAGVPVSFVGHPLLSKIPEQVDVKALRTSFDLPLDAKIIALLPGSRRNEIEYHLPVMVKSAELLSCQHPGIHFVLPVASTLKMEKIKAYFSNSAINIHFTEGRSIDVAALSDCVVVASGTAALECALLAKPMCIVYKGSLLSYMIAMSVTRVKYFGLCNLLCGQMVAPELLQYDLNVKELTLMMNALLTNQAMADRMVKKWEEMKRELSSEHVDCSIDELVKAILEQGFPLEKAAKARDPKGIKGVFRASASL